MKSLCKSVVLGFATAALTCTAIAGDNAKKLEAGCSAASFRDTASNQKASDELFGAKARTEENARFWHNDSVLRVGDRTGADLQQVSSNGRQERRGERSTADVTVQRASVVATPFAIGPMVSGLTADSGNGDAVAEPKLATLLLAALGVVTFVAKRRRLG